MPAMQTTSPIINADEHWSLDKKYARAQTKTQRSSFNKHLYFWLSASALWDQWHCWLRSMFCQLPVFEMPYLSYLNQEPIALRSTSINRTPAPNMLHNLIALKRFASPPCLFWWKHSAQARRRSRKAFVLRCYIYCDFRTQQSHARKLRIVTLKSVCWWLREACCISTSGSV